jgi:8-oxo-dGTP pyrophosphatase MutT (NUDIX family)
MPRRDYYDDPDAPAPNSMVPAVTAVVQDDKGRVLLIHRTDNDRWALPGGGTELGETVAQTVVREVREETGIEVEVVGLVGIYSDPRHVIAYDDGEVRQQFSLCFRARPVGGFLSSSSESSEVRWVSPTNLATLDIHPSMRMRIDHGLDRSLSGPYIG